MSKIVNIADKLRQIRISNNLSQDEMAKIIGKSQQVYNNIESGRTKRIDTNVVSAINKRFQIDLLQQDFNAEISGGEIMELLIGLQARTNVQQAQLISWASKMNDDPGELMLRLQQQEQKEVNRLLGEVRRKQK